MAGLRALRLGHLHLPLRLEGVPMRLTHVVENAAGQDHGGHHVQPTVVPLAQTLPARPQPQQRLLGHAQCPGEPPIKEPLRFRECCVARPPALFLGVGLHQPALERVAGLPQQHIPTHNSQSVIAHTGGLDTLKRLSIANKDRCVTFIHYKTIHYKL